MQEYSWRFAREYPPELWPKPSLTESTEARHLTLRVQAYLIHYTCINRQTVNPKVCFIFYLLGSVSSQDSIGNLPPSDYTPPGSLSSHTSIPRAGSEEFPSPPSDMFFQHRHSSGSFPPVTPPPDLTRQAPADKFTDTKGSRVMHMSSVRTIDEDDGQVSGEISLYMVWYICHPGET